LSAVICECVLISIGMMVSLHDFWGGEESSCQSSCLCLWVDQLPPQYVCVGAWLCRRENEQKGGWLDELNTRGCILNPQSSALPFRLFLTFHPSSQSFKKENMLNGE
jgi:hypothetical protein